MCANSILDATAALEVTQNITTAQEAISHKLRREVEE